MKFNNMQYDLLNKQIVLYVKVNKFEVAPGLVILQISYFILKEK